MPRHSLPCVGPLRCSCEGIEAAARMIEGHVHNAMDASPRQRAEVEKLHQALRRISGGRATLDEAIRVLAVHTVLYRSLASISQGEVTVDSPAARALESAARGIGLGGKLRDLDALYAGAARRGGKAAVQLACQKFIAGEAGRYGVEHAPDEVADFVVQSAEVLLRDNFGLGLGDRAVRIADPFVGTGALLMRLLGSGLLAGNVHKKYRRGLSASAPSLFLYYIASITIETAYMGRRADGRYVPFGGIAYEDALRMPPRCCRGEGGGGAGRAPAGLGGLLGRVRGRAGRRGGDGPGPHIHVILSSPPRPAGPGGEPGGRGGGVGRAAIDARTAETYGREARKIDPGMPSPLGPPCEPYMRAMRWASDRIGESGIVGLVAGSGFVRSRAGAGVRACLAKEFNEVWCLDLSGSQGSIGAISLHEDEVAYTAVHGEPTAVVFLVRNPRKSGCVVRYKDMGGHPSRESELAAVRSCGSVAGVRGWKTIDPGRGHEWIGRGGDAEEGRAGTRGGRTEEGRRPG